MSIIQSGNRTHDATCLLAEGTMQVAVAAAAGNQASMNAATIAYFRTLRSSAIANGVGAEQFSSALRELGTGGQ